MRYLKNVWNIYVVSLVTVTHMILITFLYLVTFGQAPKEIIYLYRNTCESAEKVTNKRRCSTS